MVQDLKVIKTRREPDGIIRLVQATPNQSEDIRALLVEAAEWMVGNDLNHWTPDMFTLDSIHKYFDDRDIYIAYLNESPAGLFTLQGDDPAYWGALNDEAYGYLHRLTVGRAYRKRGLSSWMIDAAEEIVLAAGKKGLRLDCITHSPKLNDFYQGQGFIHLGVTDMGDRKVNLYQR